MLTLPEYLDSNVKTRNDNSRVGAKTEVLKESSPMKIYNNHSYDE